MGDRKIHHASVCKAILGMTLLNVTILLAVLPGPRQGRIPSRPWCLRVAQAGLSPHLDASHEPVLAGDKVLRFSIFVLPGMQMDERYFGILLQSSRPQLLVTKRLCFPTGYHSSASSDASTQEN